MKYYSFQIVIEKEPQDTGYFAYSSTLPGCFSNGATIESTKVRMREAIQLHIESMISHGCSIPQTPSVVHEEELTVGIPE